MGQFFFTIFLTQFRENEYGSQGSFINPVFFWENLVYSNIHISTLLFNYTQIWKTNLCRGGQNINWIGEGCDRLQETVFSIQYLNILQFIKTVVETMVAKAFFLSVTKK